MAHSSCWATKIARSGTANSSPKAKRSSRPAFVATCPGPTNSKPRSTPCTATPRTADETDWSQILHNYDQLFALTPTPVIALNRAVAVAEVRGPAVALVEVEALDLDGYQPFHVTRGDLLRRVDRFDEAALAYDRAIALSTNAAERRFLEAERDAVKSARRT